MGKKHSFTITEDEKESIKNLYKVFISEQPMGSPSTTSQSYIDFNDYEKLARDIVNLKLCDFDVDFENAYPARKKSTNEYVIVATAKVDRPKSQNQFYYKKGDKIEFNIGSPVSGGVHFTNVSQNTKNYFNCQKLSAEVTRVTKKLEDLLGEKGFFSANSPQLQSYQNQLNDKRYFEQKTIEQVAIDYKNSQGFNPLYYNGPTIFYKKLQNTTENIQLTPEQVRIAFLFAQKYGAVTEDKVTAAGQVNYEKINLKDFDSTFKDDYFMLVPRTKIQDINNDFKQGTNLLQIDKETVFGCTKLFKTYNELYFRYKNNPNTKDSTLSNIKPKLEYCYRKFRKTKLGGEMFPFTNENDKSLGPFLLKI